ncbi:hypothetical protein QBC39DRAFT_143856 [Podospora conica]|nr:hypothetical protein QBC39DRAFT_143856 [Schizothecium conicum]
MRRVHPGRDQPRTLMEVARLHPSTTGSSGGHLRHDPTFVGSESRLDGREEPGLAELTGVVWKKTDKIQLRMSTRLEMALRRWDDAIRGLGLPVFTRAVARRTWRGRRGNGEKGLTARLNFAAGGLSSDQHHHQKIDCVACFASCVQTYEPGVRKRQQQHGEGHLAPSKPINRVFGVRLSVSIVVSLAPLLVDHVTTVVWGLHAETRPHPSIPRDVDKSDMSRTALSYFPECLRRLLVQMCRFNSSRYLTGPPRLGHA